ncbi:MAG: betaine-homocysteine S-methyltransferase, partial [Nocardioidaceae bacterium]|nr:betaine-homocysteine S-methyltransferase [Nocardioidaceae bacterium]
PVAAQPVPYRTTSATPAFESLTGSDGQRLFPLQMEGAALTRFEMADFARAATDLGVDYIGVCCGGAPHYVRAMAEALGRVTAASRYSPALELHPVLGEQPSAVTQREMGSWRAEP